MDNIRKLSNDDLITVLGMVKDSEDSILSFCEDPKEAEELIKDLRSQFQPFRDEFNRRQDIFWRRLTT